MENSSSSSKTGGPPRRSSLISSIIGRTFSLSEGDSDNPETRTSLSKTRTRGFSESSLEGLKLEDDDKNEMINSEITKSRATALTENGVFREDNQKQRHSFTLSTLLLGQRTKSSSLLGNSSFSVTSKGSETSTPEVAASAEDSGIFIKQSDSEASNPEDAEKNISRTHEITQNDHLNKKLLTSFLARINGVAEKIIDPSGKGETLGKVYTDDVMMDRILRRVDSNPPD